MCTTSIRHTLLMKKQQKNINSKNIQESEKREIKMLFTNESCIHEMFKRISNNFFSKDILRLFKKVTQKSQKKTYFS